MERRHLLLTAMALAAGIGAAGAAVVVAGDEVRATTAAAPVTVTVSSDPATTEEAPPATAEEPPATSTEDTEEDPGLTVPTLVGLRLDVATAALDEALLVRDVDGGGLFGVLDDTAWTVCATTPEEGTPVVPGDVVTVHIDRSCF